MNDLNWFKNCLQDKALVEKLKKIKLIITDVDGCLTDGQIYLNYDDEKIKGFSTQDGFAITKANKADILISIVTGRIDKSVSLRAKALGIPDDLYFDGFYSGKIEVVKGIQQKKNISKKETVFFGDDFLDIECKHEVGLFIAPKNSPFYISHEADLIVPKNGGVNAFRLLLDLILFIQKKHFAQKLINKSIK